jgi:biotin carboxyl carrier protein
MLKGLDMSVLVVDGVRISVDEARAEGSVHDLMVDGQRVRVELVEELSRDPTTLLLRIGERMIQISVHDSLEGQTVVRVNGRPYEARIEHGGDSRTSGRERQDYVGPVVVMAPMAGRIVSLKTLVGAEAGEGDALVVLEAMKMENEVASPRKGVVKEFYVKPGDLVKAGDKLCLVE